MFYSKENPEIFEHKEPAEGGADVASGDRPENMTTEEKIAKIKAGFLPYDVFDPETEVAKIAKLPKEEKREALERFKEDYAEQRVGILRLHNEIENKIEEDPDISRDELDEMIFMAAEELRLSVRQFERMSGILNTYERVHQKVRHLRETYQDDEELFEEATGKKPIGKVHIMETPVTLHFVCEDMDDYLAARGIEGADRRTKKMFKTERGFRIPLEDGITFGNGSDEANSLKSRLFSFFSASTFDPAEHERTKEHEMKHQVFEFFKNFKHGNAIALDKEQLSVAENTEEKIKIMARLLRNTLTMVEDVTGEEMLIAYLHYFSNNSARFSSEEVTENFEGRYRSYIVGNANSVGTDILSKSKFLSSEEVAKTEKIVGGLKENALASHYSNILEGVTAVRKLEKADFGTQDILNLLGPENLQNWPKVVDRILENRK